MWVKVASYKSMTKKVLADFVRKFDMQIWITKSIITYYGANINRHLMREICDQFNITHRNSNSYPPQSNRDVEADNKNMKKILRKTIDNRGGWHEILRYALLGYQMTIRTLIVANPYLLVYGIEIDILAKVELQSLRLIDEAELSNDE